MRLTRSLPTLARALGFVPAVVASAALFALMLMTFADVVLRSAFSAPLPAATELTRILMAVAIFSAMPAVSASGRHVAVDLTDALFGPWATRIREFAVNLGCGGLLLWPAERAVVLAERSRSFGDVTEYLAIPQFWPEWFIALAVFASAAALAVRGVLALLAPAALRAAEPQGGLG